jgi:hypothetical protein
MARKLFFPPQSIFKQFGKHKVSLPKISQSVKMNVSYHHGISGISCFLPGVKRLHFHRFAISSHPPLRSHRQNTSFMRMFFALLPAVLSLPFLMDSSRAFQLPGPPLLFLNKRTSYPGGWAINPDDAAVTCPSDASVKCGSSDYTSCCPVGQTCFGYTNTKYCCPTGNRLPQSFSSIANKP